MNPIKADINRYHTSKRTSKSVVYVSTILKRQRVQFSTGIYANTNEWDSEKQCIREGTPDAADFNLIINSVKSRITQIFVRYKLQFDELTPERLKYEYKIAESAENFNDYCFLKLEENKNTLEASTYNRHKSQINKLYEFRCDLKIRDITPKFIEDYIAWMRKVKKNKQTSIRGTTNTLKVYVNLAIRDKLLNESPFKDIRIAEGNSYREFLTEEELKKAHDLYNSDTLNETNTKILRCFLFSCYTGLRLSDVKSITLSHIRRNEILLTMHKTRNMSGHVVRIPLNRVAGRLIDDAGGMGDKRKPIFETITDQRTNIALKAMFKLLEIKKNISYHTARHNNLSFDLKIKNLQ